MYFISFLRELKYVTRIAACYFSQCKNLDCEMQIKLSSVLLPYNLNVYNFLLKIQT